MSADFISRWTDNMMAAAGTSDQTVRSRMKEMVTAMLASARAELDPTGLHRLDLLDKAQTTEGYERIRRFMHLAGQATPDKPAMPDSKVRELRAKLIMEEALETINKGLGFDIITVHLNEDGSVSAGDTVDIEHMIVVEAHEPDLVELVDGCEDLRVVTTGTLIACGVKDRETAREVDASNLRKFGPGGYRRDDGKWIKPSNFVPPDLKAVLLKQGAAL